MTTLNQQLLQLVKSGMTPEDIAQATGYDVDAVRLAIESVTTTQQKSFEDLVDEYRPEMVRVLYEIACDEDKNESARVKAAAVIINGAGRLPELNADDLTQRFQKMKRIVDKAKAMIIDVEDSSTKEIGEGCLAT